MRRFVNCLAKPNYAQKRRNTTCNQATTRQILRTKFAKYCTKRAFFHTRVRVFALNSTVLLNKCAFCQKFATCNIKNANFATTWWRNKKTQLSKKNSCANYLLIFDKHFSMSLTETANPCFSSMYLLISIALRVDIFSSLIFSSKSRKYAFFATMSKQQPIAPATITCNATKYTMFSLETKHKNKLAIMQNTCTTVSTSM